MRNLILAVVIAGTLVAFYGIAAAQQQAQSQQQVTVLIPLKHANPALIARLLGGTAIYDQPSMGGRGGHGARNVGRSGYGRNRQRQYGGYDTRGYGARDTGRALQAPPSRRSRTTPTW